MVRKISFAILALAILATGFIAFRKLNYWESSVWIFKLNPKQLNEGGFNQDIVREQDINEEQYRDQRVERDQRQGRGRGYGRGRGNFGEEKKINLRNVLWYLAVFSSFTVVAIYLDKGLHLIRKKKSESDC